MYPLFESIKVVDGKIQNVDWHEERYARSYEVMYSKRPLTQMISHVEIPEAAREGIYKLRISYNDRYKKIEFEPYKLKEIKTLKPLLLDNLDYGLKYTDRSALQAAYEQREDCDDVLIIKDGLVTDSSYANILLHDGKQWITPSTPLLGGTARARLIAEGVVEEREVTLGQLHSFECFKLVNALRDFDVVEQSDISNIKF